MTSYTFNILVDFTCNFGNTTRLAKIFKNMGMSFKIVSHDVIRLRERFSLNQSVESTVTKILSVLNQVKEHQTLWNTMCIEIWVEVSAEHPAQPSIIEYDGLCIYTRKGARNRTILKVAWLKPCKQITGELIPESITRLCTSDPNTITMVKNIISKFADSIQLLRGFLTRSIHH